MASGRSAAPPTSRATILPLNGLRGLAALWLVLFHLRMPLIPLLPPSRLNSAIEAVLREGWLGADFFFLLSGFILCYTYSGRLSRPSWTGYRDFIWRRFARTYPVYLCAILLVLVAPLFLAEPGSSLRTEYLQPWVILANLLLIQNWLKIQSMPSTLKALSALWGMWVVFPLILPLVEKVRNRAATLVMATCLLVVFYVILSMHPYSAYIVRVVFEFLIGCLLCRFFAMMPTWRWSGRVATVGFFGIILVLLTKVAGKFPTGIWPLSVYGVKLYWAVPLFALVTLGTAYASGFVSSALSSRPSLAVGRVSYSLFATHGAVMVILFQILPPLDYATSSALVRVGVLVAWLVPVVATALIVHRFIEVPSRTALLARSGASQNADSKQTRTG